MKIYIDNYDIENLKKQIKNLDKYYKKTEKYTEIFLEEGIYIIDESTIFRLNNIQDVRIEKVNNLFNNYSALIDKSTFTKEKVYQVPYDNTQMSVERNIVEFTYSINNSTLRLIVKGVYENNVFNNNNENKYHAFLPVDFYFTDFIIDDLNVFLSVLTNLL
jgi:hypothetical protein